MYKVDNKQWPFLERRITFLWVTHLMIVLGILMPTNLRAQVDLCGCEGHPDSLGVFDTSDPATWPPGATLAPANVLTIPLPPDGVLIFDSIQVTTMNGFSTWTLKFEPNVANTPVTFLVAGDMFFGNVRINLDGSAGEYGTSELNGRGGLPGPGGFRGGDGAYVLSNGATEGGEGLGPGGGAAGVPGDPYVAGGNGIYGGSPLMRPLIGGSGGGGGPGADVIGCSGGGGGGGGGSILIAANGVIDVSGQIWTVGGGAGGAANHSCANQGGSGGGGAILLIGNTVKGSGSLRAGSGSALGSVRIEALNDLEVFTGYSQPIAVRTLAPGPIVNPLASTIAITSVDGDPVPEVLTGGIGGIDVILPAPGLVTFGIQTAGVPAGTTVELAVKPKVGGAAIREVATLDPGDCSTSGECSAVVTLDLASGAYFAEAEATFQTP